jgi:N-acetylneuraminic acid mutarotase
MRRLSVIAAIGFVAASTPVSTATAAGWASLSLMSAARDGLGAAAGHDGRIYAIGGDSSAILNNSVEAYTPGTNKWTTVAPLPTPGGKLAAATGPDGRIYVMGDGPCIDSSRTVEAYTPATNRWVTVAPMPTARGNLAAAAGSDGRIYAIGGDSCSSQSGVKTVEAYTPATNHWASVASMPTARYDLAAAAGPDGRIYAIGGSSSNSAGSAPPGGLNTVEAYSPRTNSWATVAPLPTARQGLAAATGPDGRIYAIGGSTPSGSTPNGSALNTVEAYTPATNSWASVTSLPTARGSLAAAAGSDGRIYAIGGSAANCNSCATVEAYDTRLGASGSAVPATIAPPKPAVALPKSDPFAPIRMPVVTPIPFVRSTIASALPTPTEAFSSVGRTLASAGIAVLATVLILLPAQLFNRSIEDIDGDFAFWKQRASRPQRAGPQSTTEHRGWALRVAVAITVLISPLVGGFVDPQFGFSASSAATFLAVFVAALWSIAVATIVPFVNRKARHRNTRWRLNVLPAGLVIAAAGVVVSRLTDFQPGYLYGVVGAAVFAGSLAKHERGEDVLINTLVTMVIAFAAWFAWVPVDSASVQPGAPWLLVGVDDLLGALFTGGLVSSTIGLIPLRFLPGGALAAWHRGVWALTSGLVTFAFIAILLNPARGGHPGRAAPVTAIVVAAVLGGGALLLAAYSARRRPARPIAPAGGSGATA